MGYIPRFGVSTCAVGVVGLRQKDEHDYVFSLCVAGDVRADLAMACQSDRVTTKGPTTVWVPSQLAGYYGRLSPNLSTWVLGLERSSFVVFVVAGNGHRRSVVVVG